MCLAGGVAEVCEIEADALVVWLGRDGPEVCEELVCTGEHGAQWVLGIRTGVLLARLALCGGETARASGED